MIELEDRPPSPSNSSSGKDDCPAVRSINFSAKSGGYAPHMSSYAELDLFYKAKRVFSDLLHSDDFAIKTQLWPGALLIFDNRRVLHSERGGYKDVTSTGMAFSIATNNCGAKLWHSRTRKHPEMHIVS